MPTVDFKMVLTRIADEVPSLKKTELLPYDRWILASLLQKSIRRGDFKRASSAALSLWSQDRRMFYRRAAVIAVEDVGLGSPEAIVETVVICKASEWRKKVGDGNVAIYLAQRLAKAVKSRYLTELYFNADIGKEHTQVRRQVGSVGVRKLKNMAYDNGQLPAVRALAFWALCGTKRFPAKGFSRPAGVAVKAIEAIRTLSAPESIKEAAIISMFDTQWPLMAFVPLAWEVFNAEKENLSIRVETSLSSPEFEGLPAYALDGLYTRLGQTCVRQLRNAVPSLKYYSPDQCGEALFFLENESLNKRLTSVALDAFRERSIQDVMASLGLDRDEFRILTQSLIKHFDLYNDLRLQQIEKYLYGTERDLFSGMEA